MMMMIMIIIMIIMTIMMMIGVIQVEKQATPKSRAGFLRRRKNGLI